ncbi:MAG: hypothetical protein OXL37_00645, partial [Chloroflexota bacterium]|nr:hypothetical protein [Chloroflexota bacterium]MDE2959052.1 hypothetical protein [Chloroflexota bacterium]
DFDANGMTVNDLVALAKVSHLTLNIMEHTFGEVKGRLSSRGAQRCGDLVPVAALVALTRLPPPHQVRGRNDWLREMGTRESAGSFQS